MLGINSRPHRYVSTIRAPDRKLPAFFLVKTHLASLRVLESSCCALQVLSFLEPQTVPFDV
jgi:hypothetical protein